MGRFGKPLPGMIKPAFCCFMLVGGPGYTANHEPMHPSCHMLPLGAAAGGGWVVCSVLNDTLVRRYEWSDV